MKKINLFLTACLLASVLVSCKKSSSDEVTPSTDTNTPNPSGFTPPTSGYYKIDNTSCTPSMDASYINMIGNNCYVNKRFDALGITASNLNIDFETNENVLNQVAEGESVAFSIDTINATVKSPKVEISLQNSDGTFFFKCRSGKIYVSKKDGKLRMTSDGNLNLVGYKYMENIVQYARTCSFSLANLEQF